MSAQHDQNSWRRLRNILASLLALMVLSYTGMALFVRGERRAVEIRATAFLSRPIPELLKRSSVELYNLRPAGPALGHSRAIIERYAAQGRIPQTAQNAALMTLAELENGMCLTAVETNSEARLYAQECDSLVRNMWRMGSSQYR